MTTLAPSPAVWTPDGLLRTSHVSAFRVDVLDSSDQLTGTLDGVQPGGSVAWQSNQSVHSTGSFTVTDLGQGLDWLNVRFRPVMTVTDTSGGSTEYPLGVYLPAAPQETWTDQGRSWAVQLTDKLGILDTSIPVDANGNPMAPGVDAGSNVIDTVTAMIQATGGTTQAISPGDETLTTAMVWDMGTTTLKVINDLLQAAGYFSLWCDGSGQYRVTEYVPPAQRIPVYSGVSPFTDGPSSLMSPSFTVSQDIYSVPNAYLGVAQGDASNAALTSTAVNDDPDSPYSITNRGRYVWAVNTALQATSQAALDSQVQMLLSQASTVTATAQINHGFLPNLTMNQAVEFTTSERYGGRDWLCYITGTTVPLDPTGLCTSSISQAVGTDVSLTGGQ